MAVKSELPITHKCAIHALVAAYFNLISQLTAIPSLIDHVKGVSPTLPLTNPLIASENLNNAKPSLNTPVIHPCTRPY
jgi:hypothetical protein